MQRAQTAVIMPSPVPFQMPGAPGPVYPQVLPRAVTGPMPPGGSLRIAPGQPMSPIPGAPVGALPGSPGLVRAAGSVQMPLPTQSAPAGYYPVPQPPGPGLVRAQTGAFPVSPGGQAPAPHMMVMGSNGRPMLVRSVTSPMASAVARPSEISIKEAILRGFQQRMSISKEMTRSSSLKEIDLAAAASLSKAFEESGLADDSPEARLRRYPSLPGLLESPSISYGALTVRSPRSPSRRSLSPGHVSPTLKAAAIECAKTNQIASPSSGRFDFSGVFRQQSRGSMSGRGLSSPNGNWSPKSRESRSPVGTPRTPSMEFNPEIIRSISARQLAKLLPLTPKTPQGVTVMTTQ